MATGKAETSEGTRRTRWTRLRLRTALIFMFLIAVIFSLAAMGYKRYQRPHRIANFVLGLGGTATNIHPTGPDWLNRNLKEWDFAPLSSLTYVELRELPNVTDRDLQVISEASDLETLIIYGTSITPEGFHSLSRLTKLKDLNLSGPEVTDDCFQQLADADDLSSIYTFDSPISDAGVQAIGRHTKLRYLALINSNVGDEGMNVIGSLKNLECLELNGTKVTDAGLPVLAGLTKIRQLDLSRTAVTKAGTERLRKALPEASIFGP